MRRCPQPAHRASVNKWGRIVLRQGNLRQATVYVPTTVACPLENNATFRMFEGPSVSGMETAADPAFIYNWTEPGSGCSCSLFG